MTIKVKNWNKFQHFKKRRPPWIKLHREILDQRDINMISDRSFRVLIGIWLLASEDTSLQGILPDIEEIAFRLRLDKQSIIDSLSELDSYLEHDDIDVISQCNHDDIKKISPEYQDDPLETETEAYKKETETYYSETEGQAEKPDKRFFDMRELFAMCITYLGWTGTLTPKRAEAIRPLTEVLRPDVMHGFKAACNNGKASVPYVIAAAQGNKKQEKQKNYRSFLSED